MASVPCGLCQREIRSGEGVAAFRRRPTHIACWLALREGDVQPPPPSVLLVDDHQATRYATRRVLEAAKFSVTEAASGTIALDAMSGDPDVVLLDLQLPDLDGFEVCRRIKSDPVMSRTRVVPFTAVFKSDVDRERAIRAGADGYLIKPIAPADLIATMRSLIGIG